jgi:hypothetical protein
MNVHRILTLETNGRNRALVWVQAARYKPMDTLDGSWLAFA